MGGGEGGIADSSLRFNLFTTPGPSGSSALQAMQGGQMPEAGAKRNKGKTEGGRVCVWGGETPRIWVQRAKKARENPGQRSRPALTPHLPGRRPYSHRLSDA